MIALWHVRESNADALDPEKRYRGSMKFEALSLDFDRRLQNYMVSARVDYEWYLSKTEGSEYNLSIQRDVIKGQKSYQTLRADIKRGCILPPIVLSAGGVDVADLLDRKDESIFVHSDANELARWSNILSEIRAEDIGIIDGLQRTHALRESLEEIDTVDQGRFYSNSLRLEIWINIGFNALAYRMLLLNAGQKPMSMKHQIDILSKGLGDDLKNIDGIDIIRIKDHRRRVRPGQFHLSTVAQIFQSWLQRSPNVDVRNLVVEQLLVDEAIEALGTDLNSRDNADHRDDFRSLMTWFVRLDETLGPDWYRFLGNDTVLLGMAAAMGFAHKNPSLRERMADAQRRLIEEASGDSRNPIGIELFENLRKSIDIKKHNVGESTRKLVFEATREYILQQGQVPMRECWNQAATFLDL